MTTTTDTTNDGPSLLAGSWAAAAIAIIIMILRVIAKLRIHQFKLDDVAMIVALILALVSSCFLTVAVKHGFGQHVEELDFSNQVTAVEFYIFHQGITVLSAAIGRVAFITYLWAILGREKLHRIIFATVIILQIIINFLSVIFIFVQCQDVRALWDPTITSSCWSVWGQIKYAYFQCSFNTATDLYLSIFPTYFFWSLNLKLQIKIGLIVLLSLGLVAMIASLIKTVFLPEIAHFNDPTFTPINLARWGYVETYVVIITASIPCIRSLVVSSVRGLSSSKESNSHTYELGSRYGTRKSIPTTNNRRRGPDSKLNFNGTLRRNDQEDGGSTENILESGGGGGAGGDDNGRRYITKQVDITVEINDANKRGVGG